VSKKKVVMNNSEYQVKPQENPEDFQQVLLPENPARGYLGWRGAKGPASGNTSGFSATGHRVLLRPETVEPISKGGILLPTKTVEAEKNNAVFAVVVEVGHDAWSDKSTDFCAVGDRVLVGKYTGMFATSPKDGKDYRFVNDLDIITPLVDC